MCWRCEPIRAIKPEPWDDWGLCIKGQKRGLLHQPKQGCTSQCLSTGRWEKKKKKRKEYIKLCSRKGKNNSRNAITFLECILYNKELHLWWISVIQKSIWKLFPRCTCIKYIFYSSVIVEGKTYSKIYNCVNICSVSLYVYHFLMTDFTVSHKSPKNSTGTRRWPRH